MPRYRRWVVATEAGLVMVLIGGSGVCEFREHHNGLGWFAVSMAAVVLVLGIARWRREGRTAVKK
jgi:hypothetical protein